MSKAVLVVDMPESCIECELRMMDSDCISYCIVSKRKTKEEKPDWCPLRPLPEKRDYSKAQYERGYDNGWNFFRDKLVDSCRNCRYFVGLTSDGKPFCEISDGYVDPDNWCDKYRRMESYE